MVSESYTAFLAFHRIRVFNRTQPRSGKPSKSPAVDKFQGILSILSSAIIILCAIFGMIWLIPSKIVSYRHDKSESMDNDFEKTGKDKNISTSTPSGSLTAIKTLNARSQMSLYGSGPDFYAPHLMNRLSFFGQGGISGSKMMTRMCNVLFRAHFSMTKRIFVDQIAALFNFPVGETALVQARTCWFDDVVMEFVSRHQTSDKKVNVVILGAGYDTRCYRLDMRESMDYVNKFEVDCAPTLRNKIQLLEEVLHSTTGDVSPIEKQMLKSATESTKYVSCDFMKEDWMECLKKSGFQSSLPTVFVLEGVSMYVTRDVIVDTLKKVSLCGDGSVLGMDYVDSSWAMTPRIKKITMKAGEPWLFGMCGEEPEELGEACGLNVLDHLRYEDMIKRYLVKHSDGRPIGHLGDFGGFLLVAKNKY